MNYSNNTSIAILLAAYNAEKYLVEQIESLLEQTVQDWTLYIRNDGSTDGTASIIAKYCEQHDRIIEVDRGGKNLGCRNNFFRLLDVVESEYYMFCDADDVWHPNKIELSLQRMRELEIAHRGRPLLVHTDSAVYDSDLNLLAASYWRSVNLNPDKFLTSNLICVCCPVGGSTMLLNRQVKQLMFPLADNNLMFDYWIAINVVKSGVISTIHTATKKYRQHGANVCGVAVGDENSFSHRVKNIIPRFKQYRAEARALDCINYGGVAKYIFYKAVAVVKMRLLRY